MNRSLQQSALEVTTSIPYTFGTADAKHGASFAPEMYFSHPLDKRDYALGYEAITGPSVFTAQFTEAEIVAQAEDLEEDMLDREFFFAGAVVMPSIKDIFPDKWLKPEVINGHRPRVIIEAVTTEKLFNPRTRKDEAKLVAKFHKKDLRLPLNKTQAQALASICKTDDYTRWQGHEVVLSTGKAPNGANTILISPVPDAAPTV